MREYYVGCSIVTEKNSVSTSGRWSKTEPWARVNRQSSTGTLIITRRIVHHVWTLLSYNSAPALGGHKALISTATIVRENHISFRFASVHLMILLTKFVIMWSHVVEITLPRFLRREEVRFSLAR